MLNFSADAIKNELGASAEAFDIELYESLGSTNELAKERAQKGAREGLVVLALSQSAGRGRLGRGFFSPGGGLYMSLLLRPKSAAGGLLLTSAAAVAACRAIDALGLSGTRIKWVNDILLEGKKVCGILCEAAFKDGAPQYAVLGLGVNLIEPPGGFPEEIKDIAGALFENEQKGAREKLAAGFLKSFWEIYSSLPERGFVEEYRARSAVTGKTLRVISPEGERRATALDIDDDCRLLVRLEDGSLETLSSGEISLRLL
ncbi:MAG: biotin--[acetyl-CoA-carboxylase] ligase [Oscillospiraceae bacterium]|nr:biotin--[acetyl-CoA-carboxylase] ligase [Oscillospiraceae bacterium]